jgi:hypothetical protein
MLQSLISQDKSEHIKLAHDSPSGKIASCQQAISLYFENSLPFGKNIDLQIMNLSAAAF